MQRKQVIKLFFVCGMIVCSVFIFMYYWGNNYTLIVGEELRPAKKTEFHLPDYIFLGEHDLLLFRTSADIYGFIRVDVPTRRPGFKYTCGYSRSLNNPGEWIITKGEVFKREWLTRIGPDLFSCTDLGSQTIVNVGPAQFDWLHGTCLFISSTNIIAVAVMPDRAIKDLVIEGQVKWEKIDFSKSSIVQ